MTRGALSRAADRLCDVNHDDCDLGYAQERFGPVVGGHAASATMAERPAVIERFRLSA